MGAADDPEEYAGGTWQPFSQAVGSKDFWQVDRSPDTGAYTVGYAPPTVQRARSTGSRTSSASCSRRARSGGPVVIDPVNSTVRAHVDITLLARSSNSRPAPR